MNRLSRRSFLVGMTVGGMALATAPAAWAAGDVFILPDSLPLTVSFFPEFSRSEEVTPGQADPPEFVVTLAPGDVEVVAVGNYAVAEAGIDVGFGAADVSHILVFVNPRQAGNQEFRYQVRSDEQSSTWFWHTRERSRLTNPDGSPRASLQIISDAIAAGKVQARRMIEIDGNCTPQGCGNVDVRILWRALDGRMLGHHEGPYGVQNI